MKKGKFRIFAALCAVMLCMAAFSPAALAYAEDSAVSSETVTDTGTSDEDAGTEAEALTPDGNLTLVDDIDQIETSASDESELEDKQLITVQTKSGNYFYIVIDRSGDTENVYFLNLVDESDLLALMEDEDTETLTTDGSDEDAGLNTDDADEPETDDTEADVAVNDADAETGADSAESGNSGILLIVLVLALAGGGALYWFKFRKSKPNTKGSADLDDYDYGEDEAEQEYEFEKDDADTAAPDEADDKESKGE